MKRLLLIFMLLTVTVNSIAQSGIFSPNQQLVEDAIKNGIIVICQSYQLEDTTTHQRYGRYGNKEFGKSYSIGVKVNGGIAVTNKTTKPWEYDNNYSRYRDSHKPILYQTTVKELSDSSFTQINIGIDSIGSSHSISIISDTVSYNGHGFQYRKHEGKTDGWIVWITSPVDIQGCDSSRTVEHIIYRKNIEYHPDSLSYTIDVPQSTKKIWGGIFVVPQQTQIGELTFNLGGIIVETSPSSWQMFPIENTLYQVDNVTKPTDELTPTLSQSPKESIEKGKKKNKRK